MRTPVWSALVLLAVVGGGRARRWAARWNATDAEVARRLPGDDLVLEPHLTSTRAITVRAPADRVYPWLAQLGQGRGGFYSYDWLENSVGLDIHSADAILPQLQRLEPGDRISLAPGPPFYGFVVTEVEPPSRLVLQMRMHALTGRQVEPDQAGRAPTLNASWAFALEPVDDSTTRLVARSRAHLRLPYPLRLPYVCALEAVEFLMERRMLLGIRDRAERGS